EILHWAENKTYYETTKKYLLNKYREEVSSHNKMFIIRTFYRSNDPTLKILLDDFSFDGNPNFHDMIDLYLCLYAEIALILYNKTKKNKSINKQWIVNSLEELMSRQMQNGKWDSLSNTATILVFLLLYMNGLKAVLKDSNEKELLDQVKERIDRGVI